MQNEKNGNQTPKSESSSTKDKETAAAYGKYMNAGFQLVSPVLAGVLLGSWLDNHYQTTNMLYTIICSVSAIIAGLYLFLKQFLKN